MSVGGMFFAKKKDTDRQTEKDDKRESSKAIIWYTITLVIQIVDQQET